MACGRGVRGRGAAPSPYSPGGPVIPAKAGTYWRVVRLRESGNLPHSPDYGYEIPAYAGMTVMGRYRGEWVPAYAGMTVIGGACALLDSRLRGNDGKGGE